MDCRYRNSKIYKVINTVDDEFYVGSTMCSLQERLRKHKNASTDNDNTMKICQHMRKHGENKFKIVLIEEYPCNNRHELELREGYWIQELKPTLNVIIPATIHYTHKPVAVTYTPNFKNGKIFKIFHEGNGKTFVGSTTFDLQKTCDEYYDLRKVEPSQTPTLHNYMIQCGRAFHIALIQEYPCSSKDELLARERFWIQKLKPELNEPIPDDAEPLPINPRDIKDIKKSEYRHSKIFKIVNTVDDQIFIGSTIDNPLSCLCDHIVKTHDPTLQLHRHIKRHGYQQFNIVLLEKFPCSSLTELQAVETMWINKLKPSLNYPVHPYWKYMQKLEKEMKYKS